MYMDAAFQACGAQMERKRAAWEEREELHIPRASLTDAYSSRHQPEIVYMYGPYVFHHMLRSRLGDRAYHAALDLMIVDHAHSAITTERLLHYFDLATEDDLTAFFDFWVYGGFVPERVALSHGWADGQLTLEIASDVPFGTFDVSVEIDGVLHRVDVVDGAGALTLPMDAPPHAVFLDPYRQTLIETRATISR